jgi:predicted transcriptional regulator
VVALVITVASTTTVESFLADAAAGEILFHTERYNGTLRRVKFLARGSEDRAMAEFVEALRDQDNPPGWVLIAAKLQMSVSSARRFVSNLAITRELERMRPAEVAALLALTAEGEGGKTAPILQPELAGAATMAP